MGLTLSKNLVLSLGMIGVWSLEHEEKEADVNNALLIYTGSWKDSLKGGFFFFSIGSIKLDDSACT